MPSLTPTNAHQAKIQGARLLDAIVTGLNIKALKPIRPFDLRHLGYVFHDTPRVLVSPKQELRMVLDEHTKYEAGFSFLLNTGSNLGLILPHSFTHYTEPNSESPTSLDAPVMNGDSPTTTTKE